MTKEKFDKILENNDLTRKDFAELSKVKYTTVTKWNNTDRQIPLWVESWLENYVGKRRFEIIKNTLKDSGACDE